MRIGILGSGRIGGTLGSLWAAAGHDVVFSARNLVRAQELAERAEAAAAGDVWTGTVAEAAAFADVVLLAVPSSQIGAVLAREVGLHLGGKVLIDATNPFAGWSIPRHHGLSHSESVAAAVPQASVVKAFNMMPAERMAERWRARLGGNEPSRRLAVFVAGDGVGPRRQAIQLVRDAGFAAVDLGRLRAGALCEPGAPLFAAELDELDAQRHLARLGDAWVPLTDDQARAAA